MDIEVVERASGAAPRAGAAPGAAPGAALHRATPRGLLRPGGPGWRGALREVAVIAAGALAALGAQAWWQDRQDRGRERDYLRQLLADTRENERRLESAAAADSTTHGELRRIARALYLPGPPPPADTVLAWLGGTTFSASDPRPVSGTYAALVSTGDLRLVRTDSLRAQLIAYAGSVEDGRRILDFYVQQAFGDAGRIARALPFLETLWLGGRDAVDRSAVDVARLRRDPEVRALIFTLQTANENRLGNVRRLLRETRQVRRALEVEIAPPPRAR